MGKAIMLGTGAILATGLLIVSARQIAGLEFPGRGGAPAAFLDQFDTRNLTIPRRELLRGGLMFPAKGGDDDRLPRKSR